VRTTDEEYRCACPSTCTGKNCETKLCKQEIISTLENWGKKQSEGVRFC